MRNGNKFLYSGQWARISHSGQYVAVLDPAGMGWLRIYPTRSKYNLERETARGEQLVRVGWSDNDGIIMAGVGSRIHFFAFNRGEIKGKYRRSLSRTTDARLAGFAFSSVHKLFAYATHDDCDSWVYVYDWGAPRAPQLIDEIIFGHNDVKDMEFAYGQSALSVVTAKGVATIAIA